MLSKLARVTFLLNSAAVYYKAERTVCKVNHSILKIHAQEDKPVKQKVDLSSLTGLEPALTTHNIRVLLFFQSMAIPA